LVEKVAGMPQLAAASDGHGGKASRAAGRVSTIAERAEPAGTARRGRPRSNPAVDLRERILDVAEEQFARHGFDGVSTRDVASAAGATSAMIHYYFRSKRQLFDTVVARRAEVINAERMAALDAYAAEEGGRARVEGALTAFLHPVLERLRSGGPGWRHYLNLIGQVGNVHEWGGEVMTRSFDPVVRRMIEVVRLELPDAREEDLYWAYHFLSGALLLTLSGTDRIDRLSGGRCRSDDMDAIEPRLVAFAADGLRRLCAEGMARPRRRSALRKRA
jgi:AcrR family transcriptional regulator